VTHQSNMRVLFIVPYVPNLIRVRPYNLIRHLTARGHEVTVLTLWSNERERADAEALQEHCHRVTALPLPRYRSLWNCLRALPTRVPLQAVYCWQPDLARRLDFEIRNSKFEIAHVEHLRGARYGLAIRHSPFAIPIVWDSVDCISYLFEQAARNSRSPFGRLMTRLELTRTRRYEAWLVGQFDRVLVTSEADRQALLRLSMHGDKETRRQGDGEIVSVSPLLPLSLSSPHRVTVLPNGVDLAYFTPTNEPREPDTLVFSGKMSYHANVTAVLHLVNDIMPHVWAQRRHVRLIIAGKDPPRQIRALAIRHWPLITVTGTVPDIRPYLRQATAAVVPTPYGAGIQNKVLEAMACETPVVASPQAVSALQVTDGQEILVGADPQQFAQRVLGLLEDRELRVRIGHAGRKYVERNHDWWVVAGRLEEIYREVIRERGNHAA